MTRRTHTPTRILMVCLGNICRSPMAETIIKKRIADAGLASDYAVDSAGTIGAHQGQPADARMRSHAEARGYRITSLSRKVDPRTDFDHFDWIVAMDNSNVHNLKNLTTNPAHRAKIVKMTDFCSRMNHTEVPDPYYGGHEGFELVIDILEDACSGLLQHLESKKKTEE